MYNVPYRDCPNLPLFCYPTVTSYRCPPQSGPWSTLTIMNLFCILPRRCFLLLQDYGYVRLNISIRIEDVSSTRLFVHPCPFNLCSLAAVFVKACLFTSFHYQALSKRRSVKNTFSRKFFIVCINIPHGLFPFSL